jgi:signal transduction histidine kinase
MNKQSQPRFAVCIRNDGSKDLQPQKIYRVLTDEAATADGYIRVIDESGEDYLYPQDYFLPLESLRGTPVQYDNPTEPVAQDDWDVLR